MLGLVAETAPAGQTTPFVYDGEADIFGYYLPKTDVKAGKFKLRDIAIGAKDDFKKYLAGNRMATYAPVMVEFDDVTSKQRTNEMGQPYYENAPRVLPLSFRVVGREVSFVADDRQLGHVTFTGTLAPYMLDPKMMADQRAVMGAAQLRGDLTVGSQSFKQINFTWFGGD